MYSLLELTGSLRSPLPAAVPPPPPDELAPGPPPAFAAMNVDGACQVEVEDQQDSQWSNSNHPQNNLQKLWSEQSGS